MFKRLYNNNPNLGFIIILLVLMIFMLLEKKNHRFELVDYEVYYKAAQRISDGENLFHPEDGHYQYKYSPVAAVYFIPFISMPLEISKYVYWILSALVITALISINIKLALINRQTKPYIINNIALLSGLCLAVHFMLDIHLGQVNFLLFTTYSLSIWLYIKNRNLLWPLLVALTLFIKPFALLFLPYLILKRKFKECGLIVFYLLLLSAIPLLFYNFSDLMHQYRGWFSNIFIEIKNKQVLFADANHTIFSVLARFSPLRNIQFSPIGILVYQAFVLSGIALFVLWFVKKGKDTKSGISDFALLSAIIPLLAFTDINSFGIISLMLCILFANFQTMKVHERAIMIAGTVLTSFNIYDLWGSKLFSLFKMTSLISFGTVLLIISLAFLRKKQKI